MSEYNAGDLVEAALGDTTIRGRVTGCSGDFIGTSRRTIPNLITDGFTVTVIERAKPALPHATLLFATRHVARWRDDILGWSITGSERAWGDPNEIVKLFGSDFTILEPAAETAKRVLDRLAELDGADGMFPGGCKHTKKNMVQLATEFGVTGGLGE